MSVPDETEWLAWVVLQTANRRQAKGSLVRLVIPRAEQVTRELEPPPGESELLAVEEYLLERGYVAPTNIDLTRGSYTITPAGFNWLEGGMPEPSSSTDSVRELAESPGEGAAFEAALRAELEAERRRIEEFERELGEVGQQEQPPQGAEPRPPTGGGAREDTEKRDQGRTLPRRLRRGLSEARKQLEEERPWWRRMFGG
jgi:hypothetical protein